MRCEDTTKISNMNNREAWDDVFKPLKDKIGKLKLLYSTKLPITIEELKKILSMINRNQKNL